jgi:hypothetical protein
VIAVPPSETERSLQLLEAEIRRLETEYNMYFAGRLRTPPWETRRRVEDMIKQIDRVYIPNYGDRFRFNTIQSRVIKLAELWDRGMRVREEGRAGPFVPRGNESSPPSSLERGAVEEAGQDQQGRTTAQSEPMAAGRPASQGSGTSGTGRRGDRDDVHVTALRDPSVEQEKLRRLYDSFQSARTQVGERGHLPFDRFAKLIQGQVAKLQGPDTSEVAFRVKVEGGRVKVTAKAIKEEGNR